MKRRVKRSADDSWHRIRDEKLRDPEFARLHYDTRPHARLSCFLREERQQAGFSPDELAAELGWRAQEVLDLESVTGPWPATEALRLYLTVCVQSKQRGYAR